MTISFSGKAYRILVDLIYEHSRIRLGSDKQTLLSNRLQKRLRALGLNSYDDYCTLLESTEGADEIEELVDLISTNHTRFFREPDHFSFLVNRALPELIPGLDSARSPLRLWSAAASSGEEAYTMAIVVAEHLRTCQPPGVGNNCLGYLQAYAGSRSARRLPNGCRRNGASGIIEALFSERDRHPGRELQDQAGAEGPHTL